MPLGLLAAGSDHSREIHARHRVRGLKLTELATAAVTDQAFEHGVVLRSMAIRCVHGVTDRVANLRKNVCQRMPART